MGAMCLYVGTGYLKACTPIFGRARGLFRGLLVRLEGSIIEGQVCCVRVAVDAVPGERGHGSWSRSR